MAVGFGGVLIGCVLLMGVGYYKSPLSKSLGGFLLVLSLGVLAATVQRWAGYLFAICAITAVKAALALVFGVSVSSAHLKTDYPLVTQLFGMLVIISILTLRFVDRVPKSKLDVIALLGAVVAIALQMLVEPNFWPIRAAALLLAIAWLVNWSSTRNFPRRGRPMASQPHH